MSTADTSLSMYFKTALLALPWVAIQTIWVAQFAAVSGTMNSFGLDPQVSRLVWISGPISGFFTAPIVGAFSDACTSKYGRRRPYIVGGLLATIAFSIMFAFSKNFGSASWIVGLTGSVLLDISINIIQTPLRALGSDVAPPHMQATVQLFAAFFQGVGGIVGSWISGAIYKGELENLPVTFITVMGINVVIISLVCALVKEVPLEKTEKKAMNLSEPFTSVLSNVTKMDLKLFTVCMVNFFSWAALFVWWPNAASWWGVYIYDGCVETPNSDVCPKGSPNHVKYTKGVEDYGASGIYANLLQSFLALALSYLVMKAILRKVKFIYAFSLAVGAVFLILVKVVPSSVAYGYMVAILMAVPISSIQAFPFAIVGTYNASGNGLNTGVQFGILNLFICVPQFLITLIITLIPDFEWAMFVAGICFAVSAILALFIYEVPRHELEAISTDVEKK
jgi:MFS family permease